MTKELIAQARADAKALREEASIKQRQTDAPMGHLDRTFWPQSGIDELVKQATLLEDLANALEQHEAEIERLRKRRSDNGV